MGSSGAIGGVKSRGPRQSSIHRRLASAAAEYLIGNRGAKASAIAHSAVSALVALGVESTEAGRAVASAAWESGKRERRRLCPRISPA